MRGGKKSYAGCISLVFFDDLSGEAVSLGGAGFVIGKELTAAWANVPTYVGKSNYRAERIDAQGDIVDERNVDVVTCERLMGKSITTLIHAGRARLAAGMMSRGNA